MPSTSNNSKIFQKSQYSPIKNTNNLNNINDFTVKITPRNNMRNNSTDNRNDEIDNFGPDSDDLIMSEFLLKDSQCQSILNAGEDDEMQITGYKRSIMRTAICWFCVVLTGGLLRLVLHWWRHWYLLATHSSCPLESAEKILIREDYQGKHQLYYVKDIITLNLESLRKMKSQKSKYESYFPEDTEIIDEKHFYLSLHFSSGHFRHSDEIRLFRCKQLRYIWDKQTLSFQKLQGLDINIPSIYLHQRKGLSKIEQYSRRLVYGLNEITIPVKGVITLLFLEALNPFYVFQIFSVCLWISYNYYYYAAVIVLMSGFGITMSIIQTKKNQDALRSTVQNSDCAIVILDDLSVVQTVTNNLVPGDLIEIPSSGCLMHCDAVLLSGNCILDESILTGESVPVTKTPLPMKRDLIYDKKEHSRHTLFCGTKVMQTRYIGSEKVLAIVINTGNITAKGGLIRSILYPPPVDYKFEQDSYKFITLLGCVAVIGFIYTLVTKISRSVSAVKIAIEALDLITIAVPPALPSAMTVGRYYAQKRLERNNIYCISPRSINVSGSIDCVCFDKTGTLTEDGLDMWGVVPKTSTNQFQIPLKQIDRLPFDHLLFGMVSCHSITIMSGILKGDPLDLKMFESTGWILEEAANVADDNKYDLLFPTIVRRPKSNLSTEAINQNNDYDGDGDGGASIKPIQKNSSDEDLYDSSTDIGIVREFPFTSSLQRMSVITRVLSDNHFNAYCKGSPEMIQTLCRPDTIPNNYLNQLEIYAQQGYRIIAIAYKALDKKMTYPRVQRISRDKIESDLEFQGFVILENRLKPDTTDVICNLTKANIRTVMVTGDNMLTALSVAKDCSMITKKQNVITVNTRPSSTDLGKFEIYYNLTGINSGNINDNDLILSNGNNGGGTGDVYSMITNSNSVASLETIETWTERIDIESGLTPITDTKDSSVFNNKSINNEKALDVAYQQYPNNNLQNNYRFAMVGKTWSIIREQYPELLSKLVTRGTIFARMSPDQKQSLILELQDLGYYVAMCGDGANDCGALKAAHTGISLSEAESSVASPFTSKKPTISCVPNIIKEGRAALVTSFGIFKFMAAYSLVQFVSVLILYSIDSNLTDKEFLYIDLGLISIFAFFFGKTEAYNGPLVKQPPLNSLIALSPILSIVLHLIVAISIQVSGWYHVQSQSWFKPFDLNLAKSEFDLACYENYTIFTISCFQYIILAFVFSKGAPYRKSIFTNIPFLLTILCNLIIVIYLTVYPAEFLSETLELIMPPEQNFRNLILVYGFVNFLLSLFIEIFIVEYILFMKLRHHFHNIKNSNRKYLQIEHDLQQNYNWPPLSHYQNDIQSINIDEKSSPISYAEISAEHAIDLKAPENSVLNNFFDAKQTIDDDNRSINNAGIAFENNPIHQIDLNRLKTTNNSKKIIQETAMTDTTNHFQTKSNPNIDNNVNDDNDDDNDDDIYILSNSDLSDYESAKNELIQSQPNLLNQSQQLSINSEMTLNQSNDDVFHQTTSNSTISLPNTNNIIINNNNNNNINININKKTYIEDQFKPDMINEHQYPPVLLKNDQTNGFELQFQPASVALKISLSNEINPTVQSDNNYGRNNQSDIHEIGINMKIHEHEHEHGKRKNNTKLSDDNDLNLCDSDSSGCIHKIYISNDKNQLKHNNPNIKQNDCIESCNIIETRIDLNDKLS